MTKSTPAPRLQTLHAGKPLTVVVRYTSGAYITSRVAGISASCTMSPEEAMDRFCIKLAYLLGLQRDQLRLQQITPSPPPQTSCLTTWQIDLPAAATTQEAR